MPLVVGLRIDSLIAGRTAKPRFTRKQYRAILAAIRRQALGIPDTLGTKPPSDKIAGSGVTARPHNASRISQSRRETLFPIPIQAIGSALEQPRYDYAS